MLFELHRADMSISDLEHIYATCYYTEDINLLLQFKVRVFQDIARKAIHNQEMVTKTSGKNGLNGDTVKMFVENKKLKKVNASLNS